MDYNELLEGLTDNQKAWFWKWAETLDPTDAARQVGYALPKQAGYENRHNPRILPAITKYLDTLAMPAAEVIGRYYEMATGNMSDFITFDDEKKEDAEGDKPKAVMTSLQGGGKTAVPLIEYSDGYKLDLKKARARGKLGNIKKYTVQERKYFDKGLGTWVSEIKTAVELYSKIEALNKLGEYHGIWKQSLQTSAIEKEMIDLIRDKLVDFVQVEQQFGSDLARQFFSRAGVQVQEVESGDVSGGVNVNR